jgi:hypothetical protein
MPLPPSWNALWLEPVWRVHSWMRVDRHDYRV